MRRTLLALCLLVLPVLPPGPAAARAPTVLKAQLEHRERILAAIEYLLGEVERHASD